MRKRREHCTEPNPQMTQTSGRVDKDTPNLSLVIVNFRIELEGIAIEIK